MSDPRKLLERTLAIIEKDISQLETMANNGKLQHDDALDLCRYSKAILEVVSDQDDQSDKKRSSYQAKSTEELMEAAERILKQQKKAKKKEPNVPSPDTKE